MCCNLRTLSCDSVLCFLVAASSSSLPSCQPGPAQHTWVNAEWAGSLLCDPLTSLTSNFSTQCLYFSAVLRVLVACSNLQKLKLLKTAGSKDPDAACCPSAGSVCCVSGGRCWLLAPCCIFQSCLWSSVSAKKQQGLPFPWFFFLFPFSLAAKYKLQMHGGVCLSF